MFCRSAIAVYFARNATKPSGCGIPVGFSSTAFITLNTATFAPIPRASVITAAIVNPGDFTSCRSAKRSSCIDPPTLNIIKLIIVSVIARFRAATLPKQKSVRRTTLPELYGAPLRLRVENQLGYTMVKWIERIEFIDAERCLAKGRQKRGRILRPAAQYLMRKVVVSTEQHAGADHIVSFFQPFCDHE